MILTRLKYYLGSSLWPIPLLCILAGIGLTLATTAIDRYFDHALIPQSLTGNPNAAHMIATSMVTLLILALTLTLVVIQLAMASSRRASCTPC